MTVKLTLTYVDRKERTSARNNKPFTSLSIKAKEYGEKYLSGFGNKENANWKEGMEVEVAEVKEVSKDGKIYLNFDMPKYGGNGAGAEVMKAIEELKSSNLKQYMTLLQAIKEVYEAVTAGKTISSYPTPESEGLDEKNLANFDHTADPDMGPIDDNFGFGN